MGTHGIPDAAATPGAKRVANWWPLVSGIAALALAGGLGTLIVMRNNGLPFSIDNGWMEELIEHRAPVWEVLSLAMNFLGGGLVAVAIVPVLVTVGLLLLKRPWAAGYYLVATLVTGGTVQLLKHLFGRARPENILVTVDFGSFPSGHVANAAVTATILTILFPRWWVWVVGILYTAVMMFSRTYLGAHWLTDTLGALLLGIGVAIVIWAPLAAKLDGEHQLAPPHSTNEQR
jgi:membrane-associated phospholipid phosphatase